MATIEYDQIQLRRGTAAVWAAANPILAQGEIGLETDTNLIKIGDGATNWNSLGYSIGGVKTSAQLASVLSGATGSGSLVFGTSPTLSAPFIHSAINPQGGTTYTLALADDSAVITTSSASAVAVSIPTDATVNFPIGTQIALIQLGTGQVTVSATTPGTTTVTSAAAVSASPATRKQGSVLILIKTGANAWSIDGDFALGGVVVSSNITAVSNNDYLVASAGGTYTITLPAAPNLNDDIKIFDSGNNAGTNNITINSNSLKINGSVQNAIINQNGARMFFRYTGSTYGWMVY